MVCHGRLARDRPLANNLTEFYLWLSLGGVLGGVFNTLVAPKSSMGFTNTTRIWRLRAYSCHGSEQETGAMGIICGYLPGSIRGLRGALACRLESSDGETQNGAIIILLVVGVFWAFFKRTTPFNLVALALGVAIACLEIGGLPGSVLFADRSFFGILKVIDGPEPGRHVLQHGTTLHGPAGRSSPRKL